MASEKQRPAGSWRRSFAKDAVEPARVYSSLFKGKQRHANSKLQAGPKFFVFICAVTGGPAVETWSITQEPATVATLPSHSSEGRGSFRFLKMRV